MYVLKYAPDILKEGSEGKKISLVIYNMEINL
jgi:hypothetical protein